jgi:hypothetical protein
LARRSPRRWRAISKAVLGSWLLGRELLRSWHRRLARQAFLSMVPVLRPRDVSEEAALMSAGLARLHEDLGDVEGATARWLQGAYLFSRLGAAQPAAACQAQLGLLLVDRGDLADALFPLGNAARSIDAAFAPSLAARVRLALAEAEAALGNAGAAREQMECARRLYPLASSRTEAIERTWREGRVAAAARRDDEAEWLLGAARSALLREGSLEEVARVTLDQVLVRIESGRGAGVAELTGAVAARFPGRGEAWAADVAATAGRAVARPEASCTLCAEMRRRMRRNRRADPRRPALLTSSRMLETGCCAGAASMRTRSGRRGRGCRTGSMQRGKLEERETCSWASRPPWQRLGSWWARRRAISEERKKSEKSVAGYHRFSVCASV